MCNPPFYASQAELFESARSKSRPPNSACTGVDVEMVTPGGEVEFVSRMIDESTKLKTQVQWYSSMVGKMSSIGTLVDKLKAKGIDNWAVTEFVQGAKTRRWALAWSWRDLRPSMVSRSKIAKTDLTAEETRKRHPESSKASLAIPCRNSHPSADGCSRESQQSHGRPRCQVAISATNLHRPDGNYPQRMVTSCQEAEPKGRTWKCNDCQDLFNIQRDLQCVCALDGRS
jgi:hypothetical protein